MKLPVPLTLLLLFSLALPSCAAPGARAPAAEPDGSAATVTPVADPDFRELDETGFLYKERIEKYRGGLIGPLRALRGFIYRELTSLPGGYWRIQEGARRSQSGPRTLHYSLKNVNDAPRHQISRDDLLRRDAHALQRMQSAGAYPMTPEEAAYFLRVSRKVPSNRVLYVEFAGVSSGYSESEQDLDPRHIVAMLKLVKSRNPVLNRPENLPVMDDFPGLIERIEHERWGSRIDPRFRYEFARGMNDGPPELFRYSFIEMLFKAAYDTLRNGGSLERAVIYGHTVRPETRAHFGEVYGWGEPVIPGGKPGHGVFARTIAEYLDEAVFRDAQRGVDVRAYEYHADLIPMVHYLGIRPSAALALLHETHRIHRSTHPLIDDRGRREHPYYESRRPFRDVTLDLEISDWSPLTEARLRLAADRAGVAWDRYRAFLQADSWRMRTSVGRDRYPDFQGVPKVELRLTHPRKGPESYDLGPAIARYWADYQAARDEVIARGFKPEDYGLQPIAEAQRVTTFELVMDIPGEKRFRLDPQGRPADLDGHPIPLRRGRVLRARPLEAPYGARAR